MTRAVEGALATPCQDFASGPGGGRADLLGQLRMLFGGRLLGATLVVGLTCFLLNFLSFGAHYSLPIILSSADFGIAPALNLMIATGVEVLGYLVAMLLERRNLPRRQLLLLYLA